MLIRNVIKHDGWSDMVMRRGLRNVAKKSGIDAGNLSKYVNNLKIVTPETLNKIREACNEIAKEKIEAESTH